MSRRLLESAGAGRGFRPGIDPAGASWRPASRRGLPGAPVAQRVVRHGGARGPRRGLPVLVSDRVGAADLVEEGQNGWVVPAGDVRALPSGCSGARDIAKAARMRRRAWLGGRDGLVGVPRAPASPSAAAGWPVAAACSERDRTTISAASMKILHVVPTYVPAWRHGGPIRAVHGLCKALAARGHEVTRVHHRRRTDRPRCRAGRPWRSTGSRSGTSARGSPRRLYRAPAYATRTEQRTAEFDVVHLHSVFLWPTLAAARAAERAGVPYLVAPRGMLVPDLLRRRGRLAQGALAPLVERRTLARAAGLHVTSRARSRGGAAVGIPLPPSLAWSQRRRRAEHLSACGALVAARRGTPRAAAPSSSSWAA